MLGGSLGFLNQEQYLVQLFSGETSSLFIPPNLIHILIVQETFGGGAEGGVWWSSR